MDWKPLVYATRLGRHWKTYGDKCQPGQPCEKGCNASRDGCIPADGGGGGGDLTQIDLSDLASLSDDQLSSVMSKIKAEKSRRAASKKKAPTPALTSIGGDAIASAMDADKAFRSEVRDVYPRLSQDWPAAVEEIERLGAQHVGSANTPAEKASAGLAAVVEFGGLASMKGGSIWRQHIKGAPPNMRALARNVVESLDLGQLTDVAKIFGVAPPKGLRGKKGEGKLRDLLISEAEMRAFTR